MAQNALLAPLGSLEYYDRFGNNVLKFVEAHGTKVTIPLDYAECWLVNLADGSSLHIYEEQINTESAICDQCRIIGWGTHPVCSKRYHFILPAEVGPDSLRDNKSLVAIAQASLQGQATSSNVGLPTQAVAEDALASGSFTAATSVFDSACHRLHGVVHANGFGHLLRVNGREGGSVSLSGRAIVDLWDSLCEILRMKKVTVEDVSNKAGMELRVLHTAAHGCTWYGNWGYKFGRSAYNAGEPQWEKAREAVQNAKLKDLLHDAVGLDPDLVSVIRRYRLPLGKVPIRINNLGVLFVRLLYYVSHPEESFEFFDEPLVAAADAVWETGERVEIAKRAETVAIKHAGGKTAKGQAGLTQARGDLNEANKDLKEATKVFNAIKKGEKIAAKTSKGSAAGDGGESSKSGLKIKFKVGTSGGAANTGAVQGQRESSPTRRSTAIAAAAQPPAAAVAVKQQQEQQHTAKKQKTANGTAINIPPPHTTTTTATKTSKPPPQQHHTSVVKSEGGGGTGGIVIRSSALKPSLLGDDGVADYVEYGSEIVGARVNVYWTVEDEWFDGRITAFNEDEGLHRIKYKSTYADHDLTETRFVFIDPPPPTVDGDAGIEEIEPIAAAVDAVGQCEDEVIKVEDEEQQQQQQQQQTVHVDDVEQQQQQLEQHPTLPLAKQEQQVEVEEEEEEEEHKPMVEQHNHGKNKKKSPPPPPARHSSRTAAAIATQRLHEQAAIGHHQPKTTQLPTTTTDKIKLKIPLPSTTAPEAGSRGEKSEKGHEKQSEKHPLLSNLQYQAKPARDDPTERSRQLSRVLRSLLPVSRPFFGKDKGNKGDLEAGFGKVAGKGCPRPIYGTLWPEYITELLDWAQQVTGGPQTPKASTALKHTTTDIIIDRKLLRKVGLYPELWTLPLTPAGVKKVNEQAAGVSYGPLTLPPIRTTNTNTTTSATGGGATGSGSGNITSNKYQLGKARVVGVVHDEGNTKQHHIELGCSRCLVAGARYGCNECRKRAALELEAEGYQTLLSMLGCPDCTSRDKAAGRGCASCWTPVMTALHNGSVPDAPPTATTTTTTTLPAIQEEGGQQRTKVVLKLKEKKPHQVKDRQQQQQQEEEEKVKPAPKPLVFPPPTASQPSNAAAVTDDVASPRVHHPPSQTQQPQNKLRPASPPPTRHSNRLRSPAVTATTASKPAATYTGSKTGAGGSGTSSKQVAPAKQSQIDQRQYQPGGLSLKDRLLPPPTEAQVHAAAAAVAKITAPPPPPARITRLSLDGNANVGVLGFSSPQQQQQQRQQVAAGGFTTTSTINTTTMVRPAVPFMPLVLPPMPSPNAKIGGLRPLQLPPQQSPMQGMMPYGMFNVRPGGGMMLVNAAGSPFMALRPRPPPPPGGGGVPYLPPGVAGNGNTVLVSPSQQQIQIQQYQQQQAVLATSPGGTSAPLPAAIVAAEPWRALIPGQPLPEDQRKNPKAVRDRVFRDLVHLFYAALGRLYSPAVALDAAIRTAEALNERSITRNMRLRVLTEAANSLRDAKHFLKECSGDKLTQNPYPPPGTLRVMCKLALPSALSEPPASTTRFGRKFLRVDPPAELLILPADASISALLYAATTTYRFTYKLLANFEANVVVSGLQSQTKSWDPLAPLAPLLPKTATDYSKQPPTVVVAGVGFVMDAVWQHAGGPEDWIVACPCGTRDDDGEAMVECEMCNMWMHTRCVGEEDDAYGFTCQNCKKRQRVKD